MSIVGYILGLGDRHPSNIMLDRISGKIIHIDFADCFEVAMKRDKFPEKVPFRLTRMLIKALGIGGIEGTFRITCENIMRVMRENKDSLNVILAAFVHDPLTSFRLLIPLIMKNNKNKNINQEKQENIVTKGIIGNAKKLMGDLFRDNKKEDIHLEKKRIGSDERQLFYELEEKDDMELTYLNQIVKIVLERVSDKLKGTDFNKNEELKINVQVQRLIRQATSHENLSQSYMGWCPFW
jgi:FKBP12-rapamycin complex-associated protein